MAAPQSAAPPPGKAAAWIGSGWEWTTGLAGLGSIAAAALIGLFTDRLFATAAEALDRNVILDWIRLLLTVVGVFALGIAVSSTPRSPRLLGTAAAAGFLGYIAFPPQWDSGRMLSAFGALVAAVACILMSMPQNWRRFGVSALVLVHFGGILTAVTGPGAQPWLSAQFGNRVYRVYLRFVYLTNAYHFYSPEPGPAHLMWYCIRYENGDTRWIKTPRRSQDMADPLALSYYRRLSLTEQLHAPVGVRSVPDHVLRARMTRAWGDNGIIMHPSFTAADQYRPIQDHVREHLLPAFIRHVANRKLYQHDDPKIPIKSIRLYYVEHQIIPPEVLQQGVGFYDDQTYLPFYFGEYDVEGNIIDPNDPVLFWLVPIVYLPARQDVPSFHSPKSHPKDFYLYDGVVKHSNSDHKAN